MSEEYTRGQLIELCSRAIVAYKRWHDRDSAGAQINIGKAWALLRAGCPFAVIQDADGSASACISDERTIWLEITYPGFIAFDCNGGLESDTFYIPTGNRLQESDGCDWY